MKRLPMGFVRSDCGILEPSETRYPKLDLLRPMKLIAKFTIAFTCMQANLERLLNPAVLTTFLE